MEDFNKYISRLDYTSLIDWMKEQGIRKEYSKGDYFVRLNERSRYVGYVEQGAFRYSCIHPEGKERIVGYAFEKEFAGDYAAFREQAFSHVDIQALCDSTVYILTYEQTEQFFNATPGNQYLGRRIAELLLAEVYERLIAVYSRSPEEQYLEILHRCPQLFNLISLKELSSYLRITPETLSRIRKKVVTS
ncbi:MAG: Crp/Fnr family transcriptional regulator [Tannerellaceae bacterium]|nr:Crp/Fnr family transcriptional regulator [Tannerellaceae bacterium]